MQRFGRTIASNAGRGRTIATWFTLAAISTSLSIWPHCAVAQRQESVREPHRRGCGQFITRIYHLFVRNGRLICRKGSPPGHSRYPGNHQRNNRAFSKPDGSIPRSKCWTKLPIRPCAPGQILRSTSAKKLKFVESTPKRKKPQRKGNLSRQGFLYAVGFLSFRVDRTNSTSLPSTSQDSPGAQVVLVVLFQHLTADGSVRL